MRQRVFIADDEKLICQLLERAIHWEELNLELAGVFYDGRSLYEGILKDEPDIVITDISMPLLNGIEMIRLAKEANCQSHFIIISGYKEFEYAHSALKYNVEDYLLKPVNTEELNRTLEKLTKKEIGAGKNIHSVPTDSSSFDETRHSRYMFQSLVNNRGIEDFTLKGSTFQCITIHLFAKRDEKIQIPSLNEKILRIIKNHLEPLTRQCFIDCDNKWIYAFIDYENNQRENIYKALHKSYSYSENITDIFLGLSVSFGISKPYCSLSDFQNAYHESRLSILSRLCTGNFEPLFWEKLQIQSEEWLTIDNAFINTLKQDIESLSTKDFETHCTLEFSRFRKTVNIRSLETFTAKILTIVSDVKTEILKKTFDRKDTITLFMESALSLRDLREYFEFFTNYILKELELLRQTTQSKYAQPVNQAIDYIESNYRNSVKLDDVSKILDLNPAYLSSLFKKETGINFLDYLHDYRLEKAKTLLKDSNYNISEISDLVGYNDSRHFSKLFKKKFGINPSDYKQMYN